MDSAVDFSFLTEKSLNISQLEGNDRNESNYFYVFFSGADGACNQAHQHQLKVHKHVATKNKEVVSSTSA